MSQFCVIGAVFCLGSAGMAVLADPRWTMVKLMLQVVITGMAPLMNEWAS